MNGAELLLVGEVTVKGALRGTKEVIARGTAAEALLECRSQANSGSNAAEVAAENRAAAGAGAEAREQGADGGAQRKLTLAEAMAAALSACCNSVEEEKELTRKRERAEADDAAAAVASAALDMDAPLGDASTPNGDSGSSRKRRRDSGGTSDGEADEPLVDLDLADGAVLTKAEMRRRRAICAFQAKVASKTREDLVIQWREVSRPRRAGAIAAMPPGARQDFEPLFREWLQVRGLESALEREEDQRGWMVFRYKRRPVVRQDDTWEQAFHGTWWYSVWSVLESGVLLESDDMGKGHDFWEPGVYCSPNRTTARWYARPHAVFGDGVYHRLLFELRVDPGQRKRARQRGGVQWVFPTPAIALHAVWVQINAPPKIGEERVNDWDPALEALPPGRTAPPPTVNPRTGPWSEVEDEGWNAEEDSVPPHLSASNAQLPRHSTSSDSLASLPLPDTSPTASLGGKIPAYPYTRLRARQRPALPMEGAWDFPAAACLGRTATAPQGKGGMPSEAYGPAYLQRCEGNGPAYLQPRVGRDAFLKPSVDPFGGILPPRHSQWDGAAPPAWCSPVEAALRRGPAPKQRGAAFLPPTLCIRPRARPSRAPGVAPGPPRLRVRGSIATDQAVPPAGNLQRSVAQKDPRPARREEARRPREPRPQRHKERPDVDPESRKAWREELRPQPQRRPRSQREELRRQPSEPTWPRGSVAAKEGSSVWQLLLPDPMASGEDSADGPPGGLLPVATLAPTLAVMVGSS